MYKLISILLNVSMLLGFKLLTSSRWNISSNSPTLWVRACDALTEATLKDGATQITGAAALASIMQDYKNIQSSYLSLAPYPSDPQNPGSPAPGDTPFTLELAENRTIDICFKNSSNPFEGGGASLDEAGDRIIGCTIEISSNSKKEYDSFIRTVTHELGHCLGLDHPQETRNAVMSYSAPEKGGRLMIDDKMGIVYLYPRDGIDVKESATFGLQCSPR